MKTRLSRILRDSAVLAGSVAIVAGCWFIWYPLGLIAGGLLVAGVAMLAEADLQRRREREARQQRLGL